MMTTFKCPIMFRNMWWCEKVRYTMLRKKFFQFDKFFTIIRIKEIIDLLKYFSAIALNFGKITDTSYFFLKR